MENKISNEHIEIIWQAAQLKHCSKQVFDILSSLICNMEPGPVLHLHNLLKKLEPKDHTEQVNKKMFHMYSNSNINFRLKLCIPFPESLFGIGIAEVYLDERRSCN